MAPSPEHDSEPKAPDKSDKSSDSVDVRTTSDFLEDSVSATTRELDLHDSSVDTLDDRELKALLDEAINYRTPKDREGKSRIFNALLDVAEEDLRNARASSASGPQLVRYFNTAAAAAAAARKGRPKPSAASARTHGGSLQDLVQSELYEVSGVSGSHSISGGKKSARRRHHHPVTGHRTVSVSARQREGGSLPSNVNTVAGDSLASIPPDKRSNEIMVENGTASNINEPHEVSQRLDYSVTDLENVTTEPESLLTPPQSPPTSSTSSTMINSTVDATTEENRHLLQGNTRNVSYNSTDSIRFTYEDAIPALDAKKEENIIMEAAPKARKPISLFDGFHLDLSRLSYTSQASLEVDDIPPPDKGITFSQFHDNVSVPGATSLQLDSDYNSVRCIVDNGDNGTSDIPTVATRVPSSATLVSSQYRFVSVASPKILQGVERFQGDKKGLDENGNAVNTNTTNDKHKKKRTFKEERNVVNVSQSENIPGHRSDIIERIDLLVQYIDADDSVRKSKPHHNHHHNNQKTSLGSENHKKRSRTKAKSEANASNSSVVQKCTSLEEISKSKIEDLMNDNSKNVHIIKKQSTSEDGDRSWREAEQLSQDIVATVSPAVLNTETSEFHVVTKKKKSKKRGKASQNQQRPYYNYQYQRIENSGNVSASVNQGTNNNSKRERNEPPRRKSACSVPPSDKSADSSDVDSVHSLPVAPVHHRTEDASASTPGASPSSTSYADIAKTNGIVQSVSSASSNCSTYSNTCNQGQIGGHTATPTWKSVTVAQTAPTATAVASAAVSTQVETVPRLDSTDFPCLGGDVSIESSRTIHHNNKLSDSAPNPRTVYINSIKNPSRRGVTCRPAVIILDEDQNGDILPPNNSNEPIQVSGLTFGFELNEQLLNDSEGETPCGSPPLTGPLLTGVASIERFTSRFVAPQIEPYNHDKIVSFIGLAWEDAVYHSSGKVQYYNGQ